MENQNNRNTASTGEGGTQYVFSAEELNKVIRQALEQEKETPRESEEAQNRYSRFSQEGEYTLDAKMALTAMAKRWWIILLATLLGGLIMLGIARFNYVPEYQATVKFYVNNTSGTNVTVISTSDIAAAQTLIPTYDQIIRTRDFLTDIRKAAQVDVQPSALEAMLSSGALGDTQVYYVTVTATDPYLATKLADTIYDKLPAYLKVRVQGSEVSQLDATDDVYVKVMPDFGSKVIIGVLVGFLVSVLYSIIVGCVLNDGIENTEFLAMAFPSVPVLAQIPDTRHGGHGSGYGYDSYGYGYGYGYDYGYGYGYGSTPKPKKKKAETVTETESGIQDATQTEASNGSTEDVQKGEDK